MFEKNVYESHALLFPINAISSTQKKNKNLHSEANIISTYQILVVGIHFLILINEIIQIAFPTVVIRFCLFR